MNRRRITERDASLHGLKTNQSTIATMAAMVVAHTTGVACFELPLRGESLAAWLNSLFMEHARCTAIKPTRLSEDREELVPQRRIFAVTVMPRRRRLCGTDRIGRGKTVPQAGFQLRMGVAVGQSGLAGVGGVPVAGRRIESLSHVDPPWQG
jgi:hypothetical protein